MELRSDIDAKFGEKAEEEMVQTEDTIYALIPPPREVCERPPMYKSKFDGRIDARQFEMGVKAKRGAATFGKVLGSFTPSPSTFLRKHEKEPVLPAPGPPTLKKEKVKAAVPKRDDKPTMGLVSGKDFVTSNAVETILASAKKPPADPLPATCRAGFGKVPTYLKKNKKRIEEEKAQVEEYLRMRREEEVTSQVAQMLPEERETLIAHLKLKWSSINTTYQKMTFTLDTPTKQKRKENYERQLAEIEKDIQQLERGEVVLVVEG